ncbi:MAG: transporter substrate-binding domain-containing protein [Hyphomicrobiales bacterium]|nr:transporter substrate-binding domain-containing protein [Hyphomicrobiales bacterium]
MRRYLHRCAAVLWRAGLLVCLFSNGLHADDRRVLTGGWSAWPPFSYVDTVRGVQQWHGLDVELLNAVAKEAGYRIEADAVAWDQHLRDIETGRRDIAVGASRTPQRETYAMFSIPLRYETMVLVVPRGKSASLPANTPEELVAKIRQTGFRLGVGQGATYSSKAVQTFLANPENSDQIVSIRPTPPANVLEHDLLEALLDGRIDGYLSDRITTGQVILAKDAMGQVEPHPVKVRGPLHLMFSKAAVEPEVVERFNQAIRRMRTNGAERELNEKYMLPMLLTLILQSDWFIAADLLGTTVFALSGLLIAVRYNYDIFGALVLAALPTVGGGVVRDLITNREQLAVMASPIYIQIIVVLVLGGFVVIRVAQLFRESNLGAAGSRLFQYSRKRIEFLIQIFDAIGLAAFTVTGVVVALVTHAKPLWIWGPILAAITASGGGILRDVVRSDPEVPFLKGELYPEIAVFWGAVLSVYLMNEASELNPEHIAIGTVTTFVGVFVTRMVVIYFGIRSPRFRS